MAADILYNLSLRVWWPKIIYLLVRVVFQVGFEEA